MNRSKSRPARSPRRKPARPSLAAAIAVFGLAFVGGEAYATDAETGHRLATKWCTSCHIVAPDTAGSDAARPFPAIANDPNFTEQGIRAWLADPHPPMPNLNLSRAEVDAIVAYLQSLRRN